jgi:predicted RNase H-like HicB family nuclease
MRNVLLYTDEDGMWVAECPSLPGCNSGGKTRDEAISNIRDAISLWIEDARAHGEAIPDDTPVEVLKLAV